MTEIDVGDVPGSEPDPERAESPYKNLLVPLVVVPLVIVVVLVLFVVVPFGKLAGGESTPEDNIDRMLSGGANERRQAAFALVGQVLEGWHDPEARADLGIDEHLLPRLHEAWEGFGRIEDEDDVPIPLALAILMSQLGDEEGFLHLLDMTRLEETVDPERKYRFYACIALGALGERLDERKRTAAARALEALLDDPDEGLRSAAVIALQTLPSPGTVPALVRKLEDDSLEVRLNAALSLARLGDASGAGVLHELLDEAPYRAQHQATPAKWARGETIAAGRRKALEALGSLGLAPDRAELERLAREDPDLLLREQAQILLREGASPGEGGR